MTQAILDMINGVETPSHKIMQCDQCKGFYPVPYHWITFIRCHECGWSAYANFNANPPIDSRTGKPMCIKETDWMYLPRLGY